jgi:translation initiation factor 6 (eIF-6)
MLNLKLKKIRSISLFEKELQKIQKPQTEKVIPTKEEISALKNIIRLNEKEIYNLKKINEFKNIALSQLQSNLQ